MTATMMVDGRKRTQPVTLIHAIADPTGWLLAKVSTVVISPPKWHLKCEAVPVLVAQSPQARPQTRIPNPVPSFEVRSQTPQSILLLDAWTQLIGIIERPWRQMLRVHYLVCLIFCLVVLFFFLILLLSYFNLFYYCTYVHLKIWTNTSKANVRWSMHVCYCFANKQDNTQSLNYFKCSVLSLAKT